MFMEYREVEREGAVDERHRMKSALRDPWERGREMVEVQLE